MAYRYHTVRDKITQNAHHHHHHRKKTEIFLKCDQINQEIDHAMKCHSVNNNGGKKHQQQHTQQLKTPGIAGFVDKRRSMVTEIDSYVTGFFQSLHVLRDFVAKDSTGSEQIDRAETLMQKLKQTKLILDDFMEKRTPKKFVFNDNEELLKPSLKPPVTVNPYLKEYDHDRNQDAMKMSQNKIHQDAPVLNIITNTNVPPSIPDGDTAPKLDVSNRVKFIPKLQNRLENPLYSSSSLSENPQSILGQSSPTFTPSLHLQNEKDASHILQEIGILNNSVAIFVTNI